MVVGDDELLHAFNILLVAIFFPFGLVITSDMMLLNFINFIKLGTLFWVGTLVKRGDNEKNYDKTIGSNC